MIRSGLTRPGSSAVAAHATPYPAASSRCFWRSGPRIVPRYSWRTTTLRGSVAVPQLGSEVGGRPRDRNLTSHMESTEPTSRTTASADTRPSVQAGGQDLSGRERGAPPLLPRAPVNQLGVGPSRSSLPGQQADISDNQRPPPPEGRSATSDCTPEFLVIRCAETDESGKPLPLKLNPFQRVQALSAYGEPKQVTQRADGSIEI